MSNISIQATSFYDGLLSHQLLEEILASFPEDERQEALAVILETLDHQVMKTVLQHLDEEHHLEFLEECIAGFHQLSLLDWLEERRPGIIIVIRESLHQTKLEISQFIIESE